MDIDQINGMLKNNFEDVSGIVKQSFSQLFGRDMIVSQTISDETNTIIAISELEYPKLHISFRSTGKNVIKHLIIMKPELGLNLFAWMIGDDPESELGDEHIEGLQEAASQIIGQLQTAFDADGTPMKIDELKMQVFASIEESLEAITEEEGSISSYKLEIGEEFELNHFVWFESVIEVETSIEESIEKDLLSGLEDTEEKTNVAPTDFQSFDEGKQSTQEPRKIDMLLDVNLEVVAELGRKVMPIRDVLQLGRGSIIELDKTAGEPLEIYINSKKLAEGEVVVVDERFGIRITHLVDTKQRLQNLQ